MPQANVNGVELAYREDGVGEPLVFVHGFPLDGRMWQEQADAFAQSHRVIVPDLRGFGQSAATAGTVTMVQFADDLAGLLDQVAPHEPIVLCGLSMGGYVAWQFAGKYPNRLRALVLCDTKATADSPETVQTRHETAEKALAEGPEFLTKAMPPKLFAPATLRDQPQTVDRVKQIMQDASREGIAAASRGMAARPDMTALLARITVPTLVLCGEHDQITPAAEMRSIAESIAGARYKEIAKAGHLAPLEQPAAVNDAIAKFLDSISTRG